jgi:hypothetical protein
MRSVRRKHRWLHSTTDATCTFCGRHESSGASPTDTVAICAFRVRIIGLTDCPGKVKTDAVR